MTEHPGLDSSIGFFEKTKCADLIKNQQLVCVDSDMSVEQASEVLVQNRISSAPVYNKSTKTFTGMFDYHDLVSYILLVHSNKKISEEEEELGIGEIVRRAHAGSDHVQVKSVSDLSDNDPFYSLPGDATLAQAMQIFSKGIHRIAIQQSTSSAAGDGNAGFPESHHGLVGILTQSNVAKYVYEAMLNKKYQNENFSKSIKQLGLVSEDRKPVSTIHSESSVFNAMKLMHDNRVSSLPLVDHADKLVGSISLSDIKYVIKAKWFGMLWKGCFQFVAHVRNHQGLVEDQGRDRYPVFEIHPNDSLQKAIGKMVATRSHRVWIVGEPDSHGAGKVCAVVTLGDAIGALVN